MINNILKYILLLIVITSCVGTVEDKNPKISKTADAGSTGISFAGIVDAVAVSDSKVTVKFIAASGNQADLTYLIYVNASLIPIEVKADSLQTDTFGQFVFTVGNLVVNTTYSFSVGVRKNSTGSESLNNKVVYATTFANYTANFDGISNVYPSAGAAGQNEVQVEWIPAETKGSEFSPKANDPIGYEIRYMKASDGSAELLKNISSPYVKKSLIPATLTATSPLSVERKRAVSGLTSGTKYYFMVRAFHKAWVDYNSDTNYKSEANEIVMSVTTLDSSGVFDWDITSVKIQTPPGEDALSKIDVKWSPAVGPFASYRVYLEKVGEPTDDLLTVEAGAPIFDSNYLDTLTGQGKFDTITPEFTYKRLENLISYAYYRTTVVACAKSTCQQGERLEGNVILFRVTPEIAPFSGVLSILDPDALDKINNPAPIDTVRVTFDPPVLSAGYANKFELYCYESLTDPSPTLLDYNVTNTSGKIGCDGIKRITPTPSTASAIGSLTELELEADFIPAGKKISDREFCFGAIPVIEGTNFVKREISNAIVKCKVFEIKVPTASEFLGAHNVCNSGADSLTVTWDLPSNGLYTNFEVFWKENNGGAFKYADAQLGGVYSSQDALSDSTTTYTITGLKAGKSYQYGVLAYIADGTKIYSEANVGIQNCSIPFPVPRFQEWVDIFAIGPKTDGRIPKKDGTGKESYLFETLNIYGQPLEVAVNDFEANDFAPTAVFKDQFGDISGSLEFDGIYGRYEADPAATEQHQFSNSGIIRIAWKDITFDSGSKTMWDFINDFNDIDSGPPTNTPVQKKNRKYGYKIYRSGDNGTTWQDLTSKDASAFQTPTNEGLIHPIDFTEKERVNTAALPTFKAGVFVDYSVKQPGSDRETDRARFYLYKIVPVFDGVELTFERNSTNPQHIIKVVLPPPNMGLVHRLMANRQTCMELGKTYDIDISKFYTCPWDGIGAKSLMAPWVVGNTIYDFTSDLLMDRFEMGCDFTRGHQGNTLSYQKSTEGGNSYNFIGESEGGPEFRGCLIQSTSSEQQDNNGITDPWDDAKKFRVGDCLGQGRGRIFQGSVCADPAKANMDDIWFPGITAFSGIEDCTQTNNLLANYLNPYDTSGYITQVAQSENLAVFYHQNPPQGDSNRFDIASRMRGAGGDGVDGTKDLKFQLSNGRRASRCMINIPVMDQTDSNKLKPRWIPVNHLDALTHNSTSVDLLTKTVSEIEADTHMFDSNRNSLPSASYRYQFNDGTHDYSYNLRYSDDSKMARIFSSNSSKLPPLTGLSQKQAQTVCNAYVVQVGTFNDTSSTFTKIGNDHQKRLMRRTEGIVAGAFPQSFATEQKVIDVENGVSTETPVTSGTSYNGSCNSYARNVEDGQFANLKAGDFMTTKITNVINGSSPSALQRPEFITGSSFIDPSGTNFNTEVCTSKFGIQDLIGNTSEYSSERVFCDFSGETLYFGQDNSAANSIDETKMQTRRYNPNNVTAWVESSPDTGRCSTIEDGSPRASITSLGGIMIPIYDFLGTFNTSMITAGGGYQDQKFLGDYRNGDGFFSDFGQERLLPPLSLNDTLAINNTAIITNRSKSGGDPRYGKFFSPILGMPLTCDNSCDQSVDNKSISTTDFVTLRSLVPADLTVSNFPTTNSNIFSDGMSEKIDYGDVTLPSPTGEGVVNFIDLVHPANDGPDGYTTHIQNYDVTGGTYTTTLKYTYWRASRDPSGYHMRNFGASRSSLPSGRYTLFIRSLSDSKQKDPNSEAGFRCVVKLNEGTY